jgi:hypothetical protein
VEKAIRYPGFGKQKERRRDFAVGYTQQGSYAHAIATYAISEAYGIDPHPRRSSNDGEGHRHRQGPAGPGGSWDYNYKKGARWDTSVAGWNIQALKAAYIAGAEVAGHA